MLALNKWNGRTYKVLEITDSQVTLERDDESTFSISKSEFNFNYYSNNFEEIKNNG